MSETAPRIGKIVLRDFRFFPGNETYTVDLGDDGKNLLLFGLLATFGDSGSLKQNHRKRGEGGTRESLLSSMKNERPSRDELCHHLACTKTSPELVLSNVVAVGKDGNPCRFSGAFARIRPLDSCGLVTVAAESANLSHTWQTMPPYPGSQHRGIHPGCLAGL